MTQSSDPADPRITDGTAWQELCASLRSAGALVLGPDVPDSPRDRAEGFQYLTRFLEAGTRSCVSHANPDYPEFCRMIEYSMTWGLDAPDCLYLYAPVRGGTSYRIDGHRGSANHIDIQVNSGHYALGDVGALGTISSMSGFELETEADGRFELILGDPPAGATPRNWLPLRDDAEFLLIRQYFNDWEKEQPARLAIERIGAEYPMPHARTDQIADQLERLTTWIERGGALWEKMSRSFLSMAPNTLLVHLPEDADKRTGMAGQAYGIGNFRCGENEAVIVELVPPRCHHWSISLANYYWQSIDYATRQTSLNGHQAVLEPNGSLFAVIAHEDPGIANWLDPGENTAGSIAARFLRAESAPAPKLRVVPIGEIEREIPPSSPRISKAERQQSLARRRRAVMMRYAV